MADVVATDRHREAESKQQTDKTEQGSLHYSEGFTVAPDWDRKCRPISRPAMAAPPTMTTNTTTSVTVLISKKNIRIRVQAGWWVGRTIAPAWLVTIDYLKRLLRAPNLDAARRADHDHGGNLGVWTAVLNVGTIAENDVVHLVADCHPDH